MIQPANIRMMGLKGTREYGDDGWVSIDRFSWQDPQETIGKYQETRSAYYMRCIVKPDTKSKNPSPNNPIVRAEN